ncbi:MAG: YcxB family protein [Pseudomonadota bacterium]
MNVESAIRSTEHVRLDVSGKLSRGDLKRLTNITRSGTIGPTTVYYAGVTAPIISAGISISTRTSLIDSGYSGYWAFLLSAIIAAFAGISWYLIFMRWSYRQTHGRGGECDEISHTIITDNALVIERGAIRTEIKWDAVEEIREGTKFIALLVHGSDTILIPDHWFGKDSAKRVAFHESIKAHVKL